jgi:hypothetical protein
MYKALALLLMAGTAQAEQIPCMGAPDLIAHLSERYGEGVLAAAMGQGDVRMIVMVNDETGSWTVLAVRPDGKACAVAAGTDWQMMPQGDDV